MSKKKRRRRRRARGPQDQAAGPRPRTGDLRLTTPEGDDVALASTHYRHAAPEVILSILRRADDFGLDDGMEPEPDGTFHFPWYETRPDAPRTVRAHWPARAGEPDADADGPRSRRTLPPPSGRLSAEAGATARRLHQASRNQGPERRRGAPRKKTQDRARTAVHTPPEFVAEIEEKMLRQWIDDSIPALGGLTPRQAVKTPEGRQQVLELIEYSVQMQKRMLQTPGMFAPDYRKVKKMLGLE